MRNNKHLSPLALTRRFLLALAVIASVGFLSGTSYGQTPDEWVAKVEQAFKDAKQVAMGNGTQIKGEEKFRNKIDDFKKIAKRADSKDSKTGQATESLRKKAAALIGEAGELQAQAEGNGGTEERSRADGDMPPASVNAHIDVQKNELRKKIADAMADVEETDAAKLPETSERLKTLKNSVMQLQAEIEKADSQQKLQPLGVRANDLIKQANGIKDKANELSPGWVDYIFNLRNLLRFVLTLLVLAVLSFAAMSVLSFHRRLITVETRQQRMGQTVDAMRGSIKDQKTNAEKLAADVSGLHEEVRRAFDEVRGSIRAVSASQRVEAPGGYPPEAASRSTGAGAGADGLPRARRRLPE